MIYLYPRQILYLHKQIMAKAGKTAGVRDKGLLEAAVYRPQATFGGQDLYPDLFFKAAALGHALIANHPFTDGNKRAGYEAMRLMLRLNGHEIKAPIEEKYRFVMGMAEGKCEARQAAEWLRTNAVGIS